VEPISPLKIRSSFWLTAGGAGFILGILLGNCALIFWMVLLLAFLLLALLTVSRRYLAWLLLLTFSAGYIIGWERLNAYAAQLKASSLEPFYGQEAILEGIVQMPPDIRSDKQYLTVAVNKINGAALPHPGLLRATLRRFPKWSYGTSIELKGQIKEPPTFDDFDYKNYLSRFGVSAVMYYPASENTETTAKNPLLNALYSLRLHFEDMVNKLLPEPQASLLAGLLLGARRGIASDLMEDFNRTGVTHIIALSGFNITIIAGFVSQLFKKNSRQFAFWLTGLAIISFVLLTGAAASVVRAAIMGILVLVAGRLGRQSDITNALIVSGLGMLWFNPLVLRFDVGFQLSFLATIGLIYLSPYFSQALKFLPWILREHLATTLAALTFATPALIYHFGRLSLVAPLANVLILPLVPWAMLAGFAATLSAFIFFKLGLFLSFYGWIIFTYIIKVVQNLSPLPLAALDLKLSSPFLIGGVYLVLILLTWLWSKKVKLKEHVC